MTDERIEFEATEETTVNDVQTDLVPTGESSVTTENESDWGEKLLKCAGTAGLCVLGAIGYKKFIAPKVKVRKIEKAKKLLEDEGYLTYKPEPANFDEVEAADMEDANPTED